MLYRTTNGGTSWNTANVEQLSSGYGIQDILMVDSLNGWACGGCDAGYSLWHTSNGGNNWVVASANDGRYSVSIRKTAAGLLVSDFYNHYLRLSIDGGISFKDIFKAPLDDVLLGMDFSDSLHGVLVASFRAGNPWYYTTDGGASWMPTSVDIESWSVYAEPSTSNCYAAPEGFSNGAYNTAIYHSTDYGKTWNIETQLSFRMNGHCTGINNTLYAQSNFCPSGSCGMYRSLDSGKTWTNLGGPGAPNDTRFITLSASCNRNLIIAGGTDFALYKAYDSGIGPTQITSNLSTIFQSHAQIFAGDTANVEIAVDLSANPDIIGSTAVSADYSIVFDPSIVEISHLKDIVPPNGWKISAINFGSDTITVSLVDTSSSPILAIENLGFVRFTALPTSSGANTLTHLSAVTIRTECKTITLVPDVENIGGLRLISVMGRNSVKSEKADEELLSVIPNPAGNTVNIAGQVLRSSAADISLIDMSGKVRIHFPNDHQYADKYLIDIHDLPTGIYSVVVTGQNGITVVRKLEIFR
ncbi:MAG TPA: YCF48-related protein [Candidatus Kapabacteria bacterium]|nr:YCF48-related protein [Candidatus Kapabacteria bacterium]